MSNPGIEILLVEDNPNDAELTIRALKKNNIAKTIVHLHDGSQALDFLFCKGTYSERDFNDMPRAILLDLKMPKVDGLEVLKQVKRDDSLSSIPIVMLTSSNEDSDVATCYALGANSYVVKPVSFENFSKTVSDLGIYWLVVNQSARR